MNLMQNLRFSQIIDYDSSALDLAKTFKVLKQKSERDLYTNSIQTSGAAKFMGK